MGLLLGAKQGDSGSDNLGVIIGVAVAVPVAIVVVLLVTGPLAAFFVVKRRREQRPSSGVVSFESQLEEDENL